MEKMKDLYTTGEAAAICNVSQQTIIRCFDAGRLQGFRVPGSRFRRIPRDSLIAKLIADIRAPYEAELSRELATTESLLYRRGNFNGTFDDLICQALLDVREADISLSPGFRWGTSVLPGQKDSATSGWSRRSASAQVFATPCQRSNWQPTLHTLSKFALSESDWRACPQARVITSA